ncbi:flagellar hook-length control protein FliK [Aeromicrobium phragmitis]|uniref:Flagellar hook-length control protein FliK n=1 Tax=Aeromicrobium phragmitis TaxID=2478914 RepID=A0A3L8PMA5_9ACTN|nr:flagellar hook-length control protein FliK [Aeromicrobium phragmitis]RLV56471.1 flagellar hook-length control protein FliK [Aeromicrobium phragmitis]
MKVVSTTSVAMPGTEAGAAEPAGDGFAALLAAVLAPAAPPPAVRLVAAPPVGDRPATAADEASPDPAQGPVLGVDPTDAAAMPGAAESTAAPPAEGPATLVAPPVVGEGETAPAVGAPKSPVAEGVPALSSPAVPAMPTEAGTVSLEAVVADAPPNLGPPSPAGGEPGPIALSSHEATAPVSPAIEVEAPSGDAKTVVEAAVPDPRAAEALPPDLRPIGSRDAGPGAPPSLAALLTPTPAAGVDAPAPNRTSSPVPPAPIEQVHPAIARLATSGGDGVHRLTVRLHPEELGPVQITVTVRDGSVHVSLTALDDAQALLQSGTPELRRMLEDAGLANVGVDVRDGSGEGGQHHDDEAPAPGGPRGGADGGLDAGDPRPQRSADPGAVDLRL